MARILIVDDRPFNREFLATLLAYAGHIVDEAAEGGAALACIAAAKPDLIVTDLRMPGIDGIELTRRLRADPATAALPVIFYTATYRTLETADLVADLGVNAVIGKPAEPQHILSTVAAILGTPVLPPAAETHSPRHPNGVVGDLQRSLRQSVSAGLELIGGQAPESGEQPLAGVFGTVQSLSLRLSALVEVALEAPAIRDKRALLDYFCRWAQDIMAVRAASVGMLDADGRPAGQASSDSEAGWMAAVDPRAGLIGAALASGLPHRLGDLAGDAGRAGLPPSHPPLACAMVIPLTLDGRNLGWLLLADKLSGPDFAADDEQFGLTLATLLATAWDNLCLTRQAREHAARIARLNRVYRVQSGVNAAIVRRHDRQEVLAEACRIAVEDGGFTLAWAGLAERGDKLIRPAAAAGVELAELAGLSVSTPGELIGRRSDEEGAELPGGAAAGLAPPVFCNDLHRPHACEGPYRATGLAHACASFVALPLATDGGGHGLLVIYAREADFFDAAELRLLQDLAADVSFALQYIEKEEQLNYLAYYDALTGLPNATLFADRLRQMIHAAHHGQAAAVLVLDLDHFKTLNDRLGRQVCDQLLRRLAQRLAKALRAADSLARLGADRFAIGLASLAQGEEAAAILRDRILPVFARPFNVAGQAVELSARTGIAVYPGDGDDGDALFRNAEAALKQAKRSGAPWLYYAAETNARMVARQTMENRLRHAVAHGEFQLYFQPRGDLANGTIAGAEALIRWPGPDGRFISPDEFIPLAEENGLIVPIGAWVLETACAALAGWLAAGIEVPPVAVNLSAVQLASDDVLATLRRVLERHRLPPRYLELELTESAVMARPDEAAGQLARLKESGLALALDDFGTGYSSLAYLKRFPFDAVKIDKSFVAEITFKPEDAAIVTAVIAMAHRLDMRVIAEGVETESQLAFVHRHGCNEIQGYYFSRPLPAAEFEALLRRGAHLNLPHPEQSSQATVLLVDSDAGRLAEHVRLLAQDGGHIVTAGSGQGGLAALARQSVQVIVAEGILPDMRGAAFLRQVRALYPETQRLILTDREELGNLIEAVNQGAVSKVLTRPCSEELLRQHVRDACRQFRPQEAAGSGAVRH